MKLEFVDRFSNKYIPNFIKIRSVGAELFDVGERTARLTDRHDKANTRFSKFWESGLKEWLWLDVLKLLQVTEFAVLTRQLLRHECHACSIITLSQGLSHSSFRAQRKGRNGHNTVTWATVSMNFTSNSSNNQLHSIEHQCLIKLLK
jgi:hypothetical protein